MTVLVDTSVLTSAAATGVDEPFAISVVSVGELELGVLAATGPDVRAARLARLTALLAVASVLPVDQAVASRYAALRSATGRQPTNDLWIAATSVAHGLALVTADQRQAKLPGLRSRLIAL